jgi:hypothetical protein
MQMNLVQSLFAKRKAVVFDAQRSVRAEYLAAVRSLAAGSEVDEESLLSLIDQLGITETQLASDIERQQQRNVAAAELELYRQANADVARLNAEADQLAREKQAFLDRWSPKAETNFAALRAAEQAILSYSGAERKLMENVLDPELIDKQKSIESRRQAIGQQLYSLQQDLELADRQISYARSMLESAQAIEVVEGAYDRTTQVRQKNKEIAIADAKRQLDQAQSAASQVYADRDRLKDQLRQIDAEQQELNRLKLNP